MKGWNVGYWHSTLCQPLFHVNRSNSWSDKNHKPGQNISNASLIIYTLFTIYATWTEPTPKPWKHHVAVSTMWYNLDIQYFSNTTKPFFSIMATTKSLQWSNFFSLRPSLLWSHNSHNITLERGLSTFFKVKPLNRQLHLYFCWILYLKVYVEKLNSLAFTVSLFFKCPFFFLLLCGALEVILMQERCSIN